MEIRKRLLVGYVFTDQIAHYMIKVKFQKTYLQKMSNLKPILQRTELNKKYKIQRLPPDIFSVSSIYQWQIGRQYIKHIEYQAFNISDYKTSIKLYMMQRHLSNNIIVQFAVFIILHNFNVLFLFVQKSFMRNSTRIKQQLTKNIKQIHKNQRNYKECQASPRISQNNSVLISPQNMSLTSTAFYTPNYQHSHSPTPQQCSSRFNINLKYYRKLYQNQDKSQQGSKIQIKKAFSERQFTSARFKQSKIQKSIYKQNSDILNSKLKVALQNDVNNQLKNCTAQSKFNGKSQDKQNFTNKVEKLERIIKKHEQKIDSLKNQLTKKNEQACKLSEQHFKKQRKVEKLSNQLNIFYKTLKPYTNNINLLSVQYDYLIKSLKQFLQGQSKIKRQEQYNYEVQNEKQQQKFQQRQKNYREVSMLKKKIEEAKYNELKVVSLESQNQNLRDQVQQFKKKAKKMQYQLNLNKNLLEESIKQSTYRELHQMCTQELYTYKLKCQQLKYKNEKNQITIQKYKTKINMMTSLIGYGALTQIQSREQFDIQHFKEQFIKFDSFLEVGLTSDVYGLGDLEIGKYKIRQSQTIKDSILKQYSENFITCRKLSAPNYMIFHQQKSLVDHISQNKQNIIKPDFIILLRTILDNKYIDFSLHKHQAIKFQDFVYSYLQSYKLIMGQKKIYFNVRNIVSWQEEVIKLNFLINLFDKKIDNLPEIVTFRQFLLRNIQEDQILFYLSCRDKLHKGPQLQNFINSSDFITYITFEHARKITMLILDKYNRRVKDLIFSHLNSKKILKNNIQLIKPAYVLRVLLEVYRKSKLKKIAKLKDAFENIFSFNKLLIMKFSHFRALIQRNYSFLSKSQVCNMYRRTVTLFQSQRGQKILFFESFYAVCGQQLFTREIIEFNSKLEQKIQTETQLYQDIHNLQSDINTSFTTKLKKIRQKSLKSKKGIQNHQKKQDQNKKQTRQEVQFVSQTQKNKRNCLFQLYPDCVYRLGNEKINREYVQLLKKDHITNIQTKSELVTFLSRALLAHKMRKTTTQKQNHLIEDQLQNIVLGLVHILNRIQRKKNMQQKRINQASSKLGKAFRAKICEFYNSFNNDVNYYLKNNQNQKIKNMQKYQFFDRRKNDRSRKHIQYQKSQKNLKSLKSLKSLKIVIDEPNYQDMIKISINGKIKSFDGQVQ